jgi:hypothetical protein
VEQNGWRGCAAHAFSDQRGDAHDEAAAEDSTM